MYEQPMSNKRVIQIFDDYNISITAERAEEIAIKANRLMREDHVSAARYVENIADGVPEEFYEHDED